MIVDMHIHTMVSSPCSYLDPEECVMVALERKLDAICITEHEAIEGALVVREIGKKLGLTVFAGVEVNAREGHMLVYGIEEDIRGVPSASEVLAIAAKAGGVAIPAHPWRGYFGWYSGTLESELADTDFRIMFPIVEMYNGQCTPEQNRRGLEYCRDTGIYGIGGSDAHIADQIGLAVTQFEDEFSTDKELVAALLSGRYTAKLLSDFIES